MLCNSSAGLRAHVYKENTKARPLQATLTIYKQPLYFTSNPYYLQTYPICLQATLTIYKQPIMFYKQPIMFTRQHVDTEKLRNQA